MVIYTIDEVAQSVVHSTALMRLSFSSIACEVLGLVIGKVMLVHGGGLFALEFDALHHPFMSKFGTGIEMLNNNSTRDHSVTQSERMVFDNET